MKYADSLDAASKTSVGPAMSAGGTMGSARGHGRVTEGVGWLNCIALLDGVRPFPRPGVCV